MQKAKSLLPFSIYHAFGYAKVEAYKVPKQRGKYVPHHASGDDKVEAYKVPK